VSETLLQTNAITKRFGATIALKGLTFSLSPGEILGLVGENGAGKSTLIKILSGVRQPDQGTIVFEHQAVKFSSPQAAFQAGIATIHQELACFERLTVTENLLLNDPVYGRGAILSWKRLHAEAERRLKAVGLEIDPTQLMQRLSAAQRQEVAIARALSSRCKLLILDEPTASLTAPEVERLMGHLRRLQAEKVALIYVSHRLEEILNLTDRVLVLRDGELVGCYPTREATIPKLVSDMVGRKLEQQFIRAPAAVQGPVVFKVHELTRHNTFEKISFEIRGGEVVGLAGLVGAGRSEIARAIVGLYSTDEGEMELCGAKWAPRHPGEAGAAGVVYVPEERKKQGLVLDHTLRENISIGFQRFLSRFGLIQQRKETEKVSEVMARFGIKAASAEAPISSLSGGNQQKALLARWLETDPKLIILDEPTRGVDVGAKLEIYKLIDELAGQGKAILLISSDLPELLTLSDRLVVIYGGRVTLHLGVAEATQEKILMAASGLASN
jgi:rhamnose transport system ATP-binding protein